MKITKEQLKEIIKEEIEALSEGERFRPGPSGEAIPFGSSTTPAEARAIANNLKSAAERLIAYLSQEEQPPPAGLEE